MKQLSALKYAKCGFRFGLQRHAIEPSASLSASQ